MVSGDDGGVTLPRHPVPWQWSRDLLVSPEVHLMSPATDIVDSFRHRAKFRTRDPLSYATIDLKHSC